MNCPSFYYLACHNPYIETCNLIFVSVLNTSWSFYRPHHVFFKLTSVRRSLVPFLKEGLLDGSSHTALHPGFSRSSLFPFQVQLQCWTPELPLCYLCIWGKKNNSQSRGCQLPKPNKAQTTTALWQNPFRSNKNLGAESCSCFPWLHLVSVPASSSQGAVGCQICSRRAYSKMHVQPLCQDVDVPVMTKKFPETASLFNFIFHGWLVGVSPQWATWAPDCWLDCFILSQIYRQGILLQLIKLPLFVSQLLMYCMYFRLPVCHHKETTEPVSSYDLTTLKVFKMNVVSCISGGLSAFLCLDEGCMKSGIFVPGNARKSP